MPEITLSPKKHSSGQPFPNIAPHLNFDPLTLPYVDRRNRGLREKSGREIVVHAASQTRAAASANSSTRQEHPHGTQSGS